MRNFLADETVNLDIPLIVNGEYVLPDACSLTWTLRGHSGLVLDTGKINDVQTTIGLTIDAQHNSVSRELENRFVHLEFTSGDIPKKIVTSYRLVPFIPMTASADDVRAYLGLDYQELPDQMVDVVAAYISTRYRVPDIDQWLLDKPLEANDLIIKMTALQICNSLIMRVLQSDKSDSNSFTRFRVDFDKHRRRIMDDVDSVIVSLQGETDTQYSFSLLGVIPDPVTGEG